jgi:uncharacterized membrane protein
MSAPDTAHPRETQSRQASMDRLIGTILAGGVLLSVSLLTLGLIWRYANTGSLAFEYQIRGMNLAQFAADQLRLAADGRFRPRLLLNLGILLLMLTPLLRVAASLLYFLFVLRNWKYTLFTGFVLAVLTYSLFLR